MKSIAIRGKVWLEVDGKPFMGQGRERLLRAVEKTGSINAAAAELGMTYRRAWGQLNEMAAVAPFPIFFRTKGGTGGGGTQLTPEAKELLDQYAQLRASFDEQIERSSAALPPTGPQENT